MKADDPEDWPFSVWAYSRPDSNPIPTTQLMVEAYEFVNSDGVLAFFGLDD